MYEATLPLLATWTNFYVIIGTAAATLTGLMFIVMTLIAGSQVRNSSTNKTIAAFGTPNVVHFCTALLIAALLNAPWQEFWNASLLLGFCGLGGVMYAVIVVRRMRRQADYKIVLEDWLWHVVVPLVAYTILVAAAIVLLINPIPALFGIGAVTILLLFTGIHNAWDTLTYIAIEYPQPEKQSQD